MFCHYMYQWCSVHSHNYVMPMENLLQSHFLLMLNFMKLEKQGCGEL